MKIQISNHRFQIENSKIEVEFKIQIIQKSKKQFRKYWKSNVEIAFTYPKASS